jgi:hypothetical protein
MFFFKWIFTSPFAEVDVLVLISVSPPHDGQNFNVMFFVILD